MGYLANRTIYLSGAIEHGSVVNWRTDVIHNLKNRYQLQVFDPYDDPKQQWVPSLTKARQDKDFPTITKICRDFVSKDLTLVSRADMLIAYLPYKVPTTGTVHEIINSNSDKKPTLLVCPEGKEFVPFWYFGFIKEEFMFGSWQAVYNYLDEVEAGKHNDNRRWSYIYGLI